MHYVFYCSCVKGAFLQLCKRCFFSSMIKARLIMLANKSCEQKTHAGACRGPGRAVETRKWLRPGWNSICCGEGENRLNVMVKYMSWWGWSSMSIMMSIMSRSALPRSSVRSSGARESSGGRGAGAYRSLAFGMCVRQ